MQDVSAILTKLAGGDFTATVTTRYTGDYDLLAGAVNTLSKSVRSALEQIGHSVASLSASAEELNKVSQSMGSSADETATQASVVSAAAEQVSNNVQTVATGADEMSASIKEIAKNTAEATRVAASAVRTAETTNDTISKLGQSSTEIGQVIKVITSIAQQTNLLALNATIEAARAGEAGKGFAVVANEVKELAKETAKATEDISRKIEAIQGDTNGAVSAINQISQVIGQISDIQTTIASAIEEQSATTNEIGRTLAEAAKGSTDISKNIGGVAEAAHATTVGATETSKSAQSLEKMSNDLRTLISQFRFYDTSRAQPERIAHRSGCASIHAAKGTPMQALIVDDSSTMRKVLKSILTGAGFEVTEAKCGADALASLKQQSADLALFDWNMPEMTGIELLEKSVQTLAMHAMKIMMVTTESEAIRSGAGAA